MDIPLNHLRYFFEVARQGSLSRAARALRISQPGVSKIIRQLEQQKGVLLFERRSRGVQLTERGRSVYSRCLKVFEELSRVEAAFEDEPGAVGGPLEIAASDNLCLHVVPGVIGELLKENPEVVPRIFVGTSERIQTEVREGRAEFGLVYAPPDPRSFRFSRIADVPFCIVAATRMNRKELAQLPYLGSRPADYASAFPALRLLASIGIKPKRWIETNLQECQKQLAVAGVGYSVVPFFAARKEIKEGLLHEYRLSSIDRKRFNWPLYLLSRRGTGLSAVGQKFVQRLCDALQRRI